MYCIRCSVICKIVFCSESPDIPDNAGSKTTRRRTQATAKRYAFHANAKNNVIRTLLRRNSCECNSSSPCESPKLDNISETNEERRDICTFTTSNPIQSDNERQFTKLAKQKSRVKDIQVDSVIQADPDETTTHLTNTGFISLNINEMSHIMNKENRLPDKERDKPPPPSQNPTNS